MEKTISATPSHHRYKQLDSLRGIAALTVFFGHFLGIKANAPLYHVVNTTPLGILFNGNAAVMFFFLLSGFVLSLPFINDEKPVSLTGFYLKRIFRIFPAFIFAIVLSVILKQFVYSTDGIAPFSGWIKTFWDWPWNSANTSELLKTLLLIGPEFKKTLIDPPIWSLIIEVNISLLLPFFARIVSRGSVALNIAFLAVTILLTCYDGYWALPIFYSGILIAKYKFQLTFKIRRWKWFYIALALILAFFFYNNTLEFLNYYKQIKSTYKFIWSNYLIAAGAGIIMVVVLSRKQAAKFFERKAFTFLGNISYSFYLLHMPLLLTVASLFSYHNALSLVWIFLATLITTMAFSWLMFKFIERPFQRLAIKLMGKYKIFNAINI